MNPLDMPLDDLIKHRNNNKYTPPPHQNRNSHRPHHFRPYDYQFPKAPNTRWEHDMYMEEMEHNDVRPAWIAPPAVERPVRGSRSAVSVCTKLLISNLHFGVSNDDIRQLFSDFGCVVRCSVNYDRSGRSKGTAEVVYARQEDALAAVRKYDGVKLDGKHMRVEIVGASVQAPLPVAPPVAPRLLHAPPRYYKNRNANTPSRGGFVARNLPGGSRFGAIRNQGRAEGGSSSGHGSGWDRKGKEKEQISAADLDANLERYHAGRRNG